jgi:hypothetical protein
MDQILPPKLTDLELEALRQIAVHPATRNIPYRVQSRLKDIGYAKEVLGGLVLTDDGLQRIAIDREHPDFCWGRLVRDGLKLGPLRPAGSADLYTAFPGRRNSATIANDVPKEEAWNQFRDNGRCSWRI